MYQVYVMNIIMEGPYLVIKPRVRIQGQHIRSTEIDCEVIKTNQTFTACPGTVKLS